MSKSDSSKLIPKVDVKKMRKYLTKTNIFFGVITLVLLLQTIQMYRAFGSFNYLEVKDSSLISEVGEIKSAYMELGADLTEVRGLLRLPTGGYANMEELDIEEHDESKNQDGLQLALFEYVDHLASEKSLLEKLAKSEQLLTGLAQSEKFQKFLTDGGLIISPIEENETEKKVSISDDKGALLSLVIDLETGDMSRHSVAKSEKIKADEFAKFETEQIKFFQTNKSKLQQERDLRTKKREQITGILASEAVLAKMTELGITLDENWRVSNRTGEVVGEIAFDEKSLNISLIDLKNQANTNKKVTKMQQDVIVFLENLDTRTIIEKKFNDALMSVERTLKDKGFNIVLEENGLKIAKERREDDDRIYYDIYDKAGNHLKSIVVEKDTGVVNITDPDGANSENILFFDPEYKKKT